LSLGSGKIDKNSLAVFQYSIRDAIIADLRDGEFYIELSILY